MTERDSPSHRNRCHRSHQRKGSNNRKLSVAGKVDQPLRHRDIKRARAVGIDDRVTIRIRQKRLVVHTAIVLQHTKPVHRLRRPTRKNEWKLIRQLQLRLHRKVVPQMRRHILWLNRGRHHLKDIIVMSDFRIFDKITCRTGAAPPNKIRCIRRTRAWLKNETAKLKRYIALACAPTPHNRLWCARKRRSNHLAPDVHHITHNPRTTGLKDRDGFRQKHTHPQLFQSAKSRFMHVFNLIV